MDGYYIHLDLNFLDRSIKADCLEIQNWKQCTLLGQLQHSFHA